MKVINLTAAAQWNGRRGTIVGVDETDERYRVQMDQQSRIAVRFGKVAL